MQIKPHQIPHFARQIDRFKQIRESWSDKVTEVGSYFSTLFIHTLKYNSVISKIKKYEKNSSKINVCLLCD